MLVKTKGYINPTLALLTYDDMEKPEYYLNGYIHFLFLGPPLNYHLLIFKVFDLQ